MLGYADMLKAMHTIGEAAKELKIPKSTVRGWVADFGDYLSDNAKPPKGQVKRLDSDDMAVLWSVYFWRAQHRSKPEIYELLGTGERNTPGPDQTAENGTESNESTGDEQESLAGALVVFQGKIDDLTERLISAETRAAVAERELEIIKEAAEKPRGFWARVLNR